MGFGVIRLDTVDCGTCVPAFHEDAADYQKIMSLIVQVLHVVIHLYSGMVSSSMNCVDPPLSSRFLSQQ